MNRMGTKKCARLPEKAHAPGWPLGALLTSVEIRRSPYSPPAFTHPLTILPGVVAATAATHGRTSPARCFRVCRPPFSPLLTHFSTIVLTPLLHRLGPHRPRCSLRRCYRLKSPTPSVWMVVP